MYSFKKINEKSVLFVDLPIPPSSNSQYKLARWGGKTHHVASQALKTFKIVMRQYPYTCNEFLESKHKIQHWVNQGELLQIHCSFFLYKKRIFTQAGTVKKMDVSNRIKALHDCISELLEIDDSIYFRVVAEKRLCHDNLNEMCVVEIMPYS